MPKGSSFLFFLNLGDSVSAAMKHSPVFLYHSIQNFSSLLYGKPT